MPEIIVIIKLVRLNSYPVVPVTERTFNIAGSLYINCIQLCSIVHASLKCMFCLTGMGGNARRMFAFNN